MPQEVGCCTKYFLFSFNVLFWIIGLTLLGAGIWAWSEKGFFDNLSVISSLPIDPVLVIIIVALVMFILSFSGCLGSLRENIFLLKFFSVCLGVIFFAELVAGILGFVYKDWFHQQFALFVNKTIKGYRDDPDLQNVIDFSQEYLKCCGGDAGVHDWDNNVYFNCTSVIMVNDVRFTPVESCGVPFSCCVKESTIDVVNTQCGYATRLPTVTAAEQSQKIYITGCIASFEDWLKTNLYMVAGIFIGIALVQIIPICFAQNLISDIEAVKAGWIEERWAELLSKTKFSIQGLHASLDLENKLRRQLLNSRYLQLVHSPATDNAETRSDFVVLRVSRHSTARESWSLLSLLTDLKQPLRRSRSSPSDVNLI